MHTLGDAGIVLREENMNDANDDDNSSMTEHVLKHRSDTKPKSSKSTLCSTRAAMELMAYQSQRKQAQ
jgi:hypothetical protein